MDISGEDNKIFHIHCHSDCLLRFDSTEWCGNGMFQKVIIHSQKVFTGNPWGRGGGEGGCVLAATFDLATFLFSMITSVKKSVNHLRTVASMRIT